MSCYCKLYKETNCKGSRVSVTKLCEEVLGDKNKERFTKYDKANNSVITTIPDDIVSSATSYKSAEYSSANYNSASYRSGVKESFCSLCGMSEYYDCRSFSVSPLCEVNIYCMNCFGKIKIITVKNGNIYDAVFDNINILEDYKVFKVTSKKINYDGFVKTFISDGRFSLYFKKNPISSSLIVIFSIVMIILLIYYLYRFYIWRTDVRYRNIMGRTFL